MDKISKSRRSRNMSRIKSSNTSLELKIRKYLFTNGFRYRIYYNLPGKPDIVFPNYKKVIFVNGCFWHMHGCRLSRIPRTRISFWEQKLIRNKNRDAEVNLILSKLGWKVFCLWECEIEEDFNSVINKLIKFLK